ncbi:hypothetical protein [Francisella salimarina]|uniref:hypothetical protein n=1 Tax=Francisella salimarina TaxID=2599927 RepID=UPI00374FECC9
MTKNNKSNKISDSDLDKISGGLDKNALVRSHDPVMTSAIETKRSFEPKKHVKDNDKSS